MASWNGRAGDQEGPAKGKLERQSKGSERSDEKQAGKAEQGTRKV